jgi:hypothetical protein
VRLLDGSGVSREVHAPFCERPGVQFLRPTCHSLHWCMDVVLADDQMRSRTDHAAHNLAVVRHLALNAIRHAPPYCKGGLKARRLAAASSDDYRAIVLGLV